MIVAPRRGESYLEAEQRIPLPIGRVFAFFSDPRNLERITPPWLRFHVERCSTEELREGTLLDYRLRLRGVPLRWRSRIACWEPPYRFIDEQLRGPYKLWVHEHSFRQLGGETLMTDRVRYAVPGGRLVDKLLVRPDLERIFRFRAQALEDALEELRASEAA